MNYGDGSGTQPLTLSGTSFGLSHAYADNGSYTVTVTVNDDDGGTGSDTILVTVDNVAPTATLGNNGPKNEGAAVTVSFSNPSDPSSADTAAGLRYAFACDGGSLSGATYANSGTSASTSCTFGDNGSYTVRGRIIDKDGAFAESTTAVTVNNAAPTATFNAPTSVNAGDPINLSLTAPLDVAADLATLQYAFDCGDGGGYDPFGATSTKACSTSSPGNRAVKGKVRDKDSGETEYTASVTVNPVRLTGKVALEARGSEGDSRWVTELFRTDGSTTCGIELFQPGTSTSRGKFCATTDANGRFSVELTGVVAGAYDVEVKGGDTLSNKRNAVSLPSGTDVDLGILQVGDANGNNQINGGDVSYMVPSFLFCSGDPSFRPYADTNRNNCINGADFSASKFTAPAVTGTVTVATIRFRAKAQASDTPVTFIHSGPRQSDLLLAGGSLGPTLNSGTVDVGATRTLNLVIAGTGTVTGPQLNCSVSCTRAYSDNQQITLTASPSGSSIFAGWSGACSGTGTCQLLMNGDKAVTATFTPGSDCSAPTAIIQRPSPGTQRSRTVRFKGTATAECGPTSLLWNFGDPASSSNTSRSTRPRHKFSGPGTYTVTYTVTDRDGQQAEDTVVITVR